MSFPANSLRTATWILGVSVAIAACGGGRTSMLPPSCQIVVDPLELDFGDVLPGTTEGRSLRVRNVGGADCALTHIALGPSSDSSFAKITPITTSTIEPGRSLFIVVAFAPASAKVPLNRTGELGFDVNDERTSHVTVPLRAEIQSDCKLAVSPTAVDFGRVALETPPTQSVRSVEVSNKGTGPCELRDLALSATSDKQFNLATRDAFSLEPGQRKSIAVSFVAEDAAKPHHRTGELLFQSNDSTSSKTTVPLSADIDVGCDLSWSPASVDFGNVMLNTTANGRVSLSNDGTDTCYVSAIQITPDSDKNFRLTSGSSAVTVSPGGTAVLMLVFDAADSAPPHLKTGTLAFQTGNQRAPSGKIPLAAYVNSVCVEASQWIYTLDVDKKLARFDPNTLKFTDIATLRCPTSFRPNSMAVDQHAVAWVAYEDGNLFKVDTTTGACQSTSFVPSQHGLTVFGMGFVFDPSTGVDTLFIAGGASTGQRDSSLATVSFPSLVVTPVGTVEAGFPEMSGTGDGELWGFIPADASASYKAALVKLSPRSGATLESHEYNDLTDRGAWAMKFWGGDFWMFLGRSVYKASRRTPEFLQPVILNAGRAEIVGAGVSTCAPLQPSSD
jgi:hypothetical protein